mmetsp:Transcript_26644/g.58650  ORF Transcript_26644/g.58650 Transcript_26644/m.58650 type:complete len:273 (-) Transcript_26644:537-1355(-)
MSIPAMHYSVATTRTTSLLLLLLALAGPSHGFRPQHRSEFPPGQTQIQRPQRTATPCPRCFPSSSSLSVGADFFRDESSSNSNGAASKTRASAECDIEAAIGTAHVSEYERDAEFYRKRNEAYYNSLRKIESDNGVTPSSSAAVSTSVSETTSTHAHHVSSPHAPPSSGSKVGSESDDPNRWVIDSINTSLKASHSSFKHVESSTNSLLKGKPLVALGLFALAGVIVAYLSGFFFLEGYIENWNPVENDMIPYWDDAEIHTIERALPPTEGV